MTTQVTAMTTATAVQPLPSKKITLGLGCAIVFQLLVLAGEYIGAAMPGWTGQEIRVHTVPYDPRSLFRGNYARLNYNFSTIDATQLPNHQQLRNGEIVYLPLSADAAGIYQAAGATLERPNEGIFLRGRIANRQWQQDTEQFSLNFGIEAFFAPKQKALQLERDLRNGGIAVIMVDSSGKAILQAIEPLPAPPPESPASTASP